MNRRVAFFVVGLLGFLGITLGAFGAHALNGVLDAPRMSIWNTAVLYHLIHTPVILWLAGRKIVSPTPVLLFTSGLILFSGSLYTLALTGIQWLGAITPLGGILILGGWAWIAFLAYRFECTQE